VIARVEALIAGLGQLEAQEPARAYVEAGADAVLIHSRQRDPGEVIAFTEAWDGRAPLVAVPTQYPSISLTELEDIGIRVVIYANQALRASVRAVDDVLRHIREAGSTSAIESAVATMQEVFELQDVPMMDDTERMAYAVADGRHQ